MSVIEVHWTALIAISELAVIVSGLLLLLALRGQARAKADHAAATELVQRVSNESERRRDELDTLLAHRNELEEAERQSTATRLLKAEGNFYDHLVRTYIERNPEGVRMMDHRLQELLEPYQELAISAPAGSGSDGDVADQLEEQADSPAEATPEPEPVPVPVPVPKVATPEPVEVQLSPQRARQEVELYKETLNLVFREYTAMFGVQLDGSTPLSAQEIIARLESGKLDGMEADTGRIPTRSEDQPITSNQS